MKLTLFQGILLGVFGLFGIIGIFVFATYTNDNTGSEGIGAVVAWGTLPKDAVNRTLTEATQTDNELKNVSYVEKDSATLANDLAAAIVGGVGPDLIIASQEDLLSLSSFIDPVGLSTVSLQTFADAFASGGNVFAAPVGVGFYGLPFLIDPLVLYSNKSILASNGIAKAPATWEALTGLVPTIAQLSSSRQINRGLIGLGSYDNVANARSILSALFLQSGVSIVSADPSGARVPNLGTSADKGVPPGHAVVTFYTQFADPSKVSYTWNASLPDSRSAFLAGGVALYIGHASESSFLRDASPNLDFAVSPLLQPATAAGKKTYGRIYALMIPRGARNPNGAFQAAGYLTNNLEQHLSATFTGMAPATRSALSSPPQDPAAAVAYQSALYTEGWLSPGIAATDRIFSGMIGNVITGRSDVDAALSSAESSLGALLQ